MRTDFTDICRKISCPAPKICDPEGCQDRSAELAYLVISKQLKDLEDFFQALNDVRLSPIDVAKESTLPSGPFCSVGDRKSPRFYNTAEWKPLRCKDDIIIDGRQRTNKETMLRKITCAYGLFTEDIGERWDAHIKKPDGFEGVIQINGTSIEITTKSSEITIGVTDERYRFCKNKVTEAISVGTDRLGAFGRTLLALHGRYLEVHYKRRVLGADKEFCVENSKAPLQALISALDLLGISPRLFVHTKVELFITGRIASKEVLMDISFYSRILEFKDLELRVLIHHLQRSICEATCDDRAYDLYSLVIFLARTCNDPDANNHYTDVPSRVQKDGLKKKKPSRHPSLEIVGGLSRFFLSRETGASPALRTADYELPIMYDAVLDRATFTSLAAGITDALAPSSKKSTERMCLRILKYIKVGLKMNIEYVRKVILPTNGSTVGTLLVYQVYKALGLNTEAREFGRCFERVGEKFCDELNSLLKHGSDVSRLYGELATKFDLCDSYFERTFANKIAMVHRGRIRKARSMEDLQGIYRSIQSFNKVFQSRNRVPEQMLKEKAAKLISRVE